MVISSFYNWLFAADVLIFKVDEKGEKQVVIRVGDKVSVYSERFSTWFSDGIVTATFRDRLKVRYGFSKYFGWTFSRGNEKTVLINDLKETVRPHKLFEESDSGSLRLVAPSAKRGKFHSKPVAVQKAIRPADPLAKVLSAHENKHC